MTEFKEFPKIPRLFREIVITEKIDGSNAAIGITEDGEVYAQSRKRIITPDQDNFGFARWVAERSYQLTTTLGPGLHFGEWWGSGVQRGYGRTDGQRTFSLFNTARWGDVDGRIDGVAVVPVLYSGPFSQGEIERSVDHLRSRGSLAAPGFMRPEGVIVFHTAANSGFKITLEKDEAPKSLVA